MTDLDTIVAMLERTGQTFIATPWADGGVTVWIYAHPDAGEGALGVRAIFAPDGSLVRLYAERP